MNASIGEAKAKTGGGGRKASEDDARPKVNESPILTEWLSSQPIREWARVHPRLTQVDLRPYLFVTKDKKDYFGATSALGHLASVVERLLGPQITVQALEPELRLLAVPEASQVFRALRMRILSADTLDTEPAGVAGLTVLVKAHPVLQSGLLDLLEALPANRCGPWAVGGWSSAVRDSEMSARFDALLLRWSTSGGSVLQAAASATLQTRRTRPGNR